MAKWKTANPSRSFNLWAWGSAVLWTLLFALSYAWNQHHVDSTVADQAYAQAAAAIEKDMVYRSLVSSVGGVYMPKDKVAPNPYLAHIDHRDVETLDGQELTLVNSSYFTRLVHDREAEINPDGIQGHSTAYFPLRAQNAPDIWEKDGLSRLKGGAKEWVEITKFKGEDFLRMIRPRYTNASCYGCHPNEPSKVGEVMGGISVNIPLKALQTEAVLQGNKLSLWHFTIWALGILGLLIAWRLLGTQQQEMHHLAMHDELTGLPNRTLFMDRLQQRLETAKRHQHTGAILFLDMDHFKNINDSLGHDVGDQLLKQVSERQTILLSEEDTVARLGGDEFVILLAELNSDANLAVSEAQEVAEKLCDTLSQPYHVGSKILHTSPSIGISIFTQKSISADQVLKQADAAMYKAKDSGRNNYQFFLPEMQKIVEERLELENALREAISSDQLELYYQQKCTAKRNACEIVGAEALLRWNHPERGMVPPNEFIPLAEERGLIVELGNWVLREVCQQISAWEPYFAGWARGRISINISPRQFKQKDFVQQVMDIINEGNVDPHRLEFELTESLLVDDIEDVSTKMQMLREFGINFSIDDFGTGYSSLSYLKRLPANTIKIDRSFVKDIGVDQNDDAIVETILAMAWRLGFNTVAEGVETREHLAFLQARQCDAYQGYLYSKPISAEDFEAVLRSRQTKFA